MNCGQYPIDDIHPPVPSPLSVKWINFNPSMDK